MPVVFAGDAKACADLLQSRKHDIDCQGVDRHQHRHHRNKFSLAHPLQASSRRVSGGIHDFKPAKTNKDKGVGTADAFDMEIPDFPGTD